MVKSMERYMKRKEKPNRTFQLHNETNLQLSKAFNGEHLTNASLSCFLKRNLLQIPSKTKLNVMSGISRGT